MRRGRLRASVPALLVAATLIWTGCGGAAPGSAQRASSAHASAAAPSRPSAPASGGGPGAPVPSVSLGFNPTLLDNLPLMLPVDLGLFRKEGLRVTVSKINASGDTLIAPVAHGLIDMINGPNSAALYAAIASGAPLRIIASVSEAHAGSLDASRVVVRKAAWDSGEIRTLSDLRGKRIGSTTKGTPFDWLLRALLSKAGIPISATHFTTGLNIAAAIAALRNNSEDVVAMGEPSALKTQQAGIGVRWLGVNELLPGLQRSFLVVNANFMQAHPDTVRRFLIAYLEGVRAMDGAGDRWTPQLLDTAVRWTSIPRSTILALGGVPYTRPDGAVKASSIRAGEDFFHQSGLLSHTVPVGEAVSTTLLSQADQALAGSTASHGASSTGGGGG